jgi:hypothetical protein
LRPMTPPMRRTSHLGVLREAFHRGAIDHAE